LDRESDRPAEKECSTAPERSILVTGLQQEEIDMRLRGQLFCLVGIGATMALSIAFRGSAVAAEAPAGQSAFVANKCNLCHSVSSAGIEATAKSEKMKGPDLKGKVAEVGIDWARKFVTKQVDKDGKKHGKEYKGTPEDLEQILTWLESQK
jgi:hypothetical protein